MKDARVFINDKYRNSIAFGALYKQKKINISKSIDEKCINTIFTHTTISILQMYIYLKAITKA
jgi:hypothetical protein